MNSFFVNTGVSHQRQLGRSAMTSSWPFPGPCRISDEVAVGPLPSDWLLVSDAPLVVLVGLTGAGKTTLARMLSASGCVELLPDRRRLTDAVILGENAATLDRAGRFAATARFRGAAPGGMGEVLAALSVAKRPAQPHLFDGLRGADEIAYFAPRAPNAVFLAFQVSDKTRAQRIASRSDGFDGAASGSATKAQALVADEATHYSLGAALDALAAHAPGRFHVLDAEGASPDQLAAQVKTLIAVAYP